MLALLSPAKKLDEKTSSSQQLTTPRLLEDATKLAKIMRGYSPAQLASTLLISDKLAQLNVARFQQWQPQTNEHSGAAILMFQGDVYQGLQADTLTRRQIQQAQKKLRILSGLYGLLRPLDAIQPYRLEMGKKIKTSQGDNLYKYWKNKITDLINKDLQETKSSLLLNLASAEYFSAVQESSIQARIISPKFLDQKNGKLKPIQLYVKRARGLMARFILEHSPKTARDIEKFDYQGYAFNKSMSTPETPVFVRIQTRC